MPMNAANAPTPIRRHSYVIIKLKSLWNLKADQAGCYEQSLHWKQFVYPLAIVCT